MQKIFTGFWYHVREILALAVSVLVFIIVFSCLFVEDVWLKLRREFIIFAWGYCGDAVDLIMAFPGAIFAGIRALVDDEYRMEQMDSAVLYYPQPCKFKV
ncbi:MAG: hypothetical protein HZB10_01435 [Candidatus Yonathbacteria bacterium]|nr:hypothetical protein [Candidatus Yonathbacteria bacterium]